MLRAHSSTRSTPSRHEGSPSHTRLSVNAPLLTKYPTNDLCVSVHTFTSPPAQVVNPAAAIEFRENTADDPGKRRPDITKVKTALGWEPKVRACCYYGSC